VEPSAAKRADTELAIVQPMRPAPIVPLPQSDPAVLERSTALARTGGDPALLAEILDIFAEETPSLVSAIEQAVAARDRDHVHRLAHTLKGSAANVSALATQAAARALEHAARDRADEHLPALAEALKVESRRVLAAIAAGRETTATAVAISA